MKKKAVGLWESFRDFVFKGNVISLATGIIIGGAFTKITSSLVGDIVMPALSLVTGRIDFSNMFIALNGQKYHTLAAAKENTSVIAYGSFITVVLDFFIMAFFIFLITRWIGIMVEKAKKKEEADAAPDTAECPFCKSEINAEAVRCPHCTSELEKTSREMMV